MADKALSMAQEHAPWRENVAWWVTGIQGVVVVLIGLYLLLAPASAAQLVILLIAIALLLSSIPQIVAGLRGIGGVRAAYAMLQAGVGATVGLLIALRALLVPTLDPYAARTILALGLIAYALIGLAGSFLSGGEPASWAGPIVNALLLIVLAVVLLTSSESNAADRLGLLGWIALIGGALLLFFAWRAYNRQHTVV
ncbi:MAG: hypothetical protein IT337_06715 [Thermomicrobiales bacterium]|nr:hypothetical protein [Thermomicrobiales bacterium]